VAVARLRLLLAGLLLCLGTSWGALPATAVWEIEYGGTSSQAGGGFCGDSVPVSSGVWTPSSSAPTLTLGASGGSLSASTTYYIVIAPVGPTGTAPGSASTSQATNTTQKQITVTLPTLPGLATSWNVYASTSSTGPFYRQTTAQTGTSYNFSSYTSSGSTDGLQAYGTDDSQQTSYDYTSSTMSSSNGTNANPLVTITGHTSVPADVGRILQITAGTSWLTGFYEITGIDGSGNVYLDRACGSAATLSSGTGYVGGALATLQDAITTTTFSTVPAVSGNDVYVKYNASAYTLSGSQSCALTVDNSSGRWSRFVGYSTASERNPWSIPANRPTLQLTSAAYVFTTLTGGERFQNLIFDSNTTGGYGYGVASSNVTDIWINCRDENLSISGDTGWSQASGLFDYCEVDATGSNNVDCFNGKCWHSYANLSGNTGAGSVGFYQNSDGYCVAVGSGTTKGIAYESGNATVQVNCVASKFEYAFETTTTSTNFSLVKNSVAGTCGTFVQGNGSNGVSGTLLLEADAEYNCSTIIGTDFQQSNVLGSALTGGTLANILQLSVDPFVSDSTGDFSLNNTAGGGALLRGAGIGIIAGLSPSVPGVPDIGAYQHASTGSATTNQVIGG
jgi:hypothetical protein